MAVGHEAKRQSPSSEGAALDLMKPGTKERLAMTSIAAIKEFFGTPDRPVENKELLELKKRLKTEEWEQMGKDCAKALGQEWTKA